MKTVLILSMALLLNGCNKNNSAEVQKWKDEIVKADTDMSDYAAKEGFSAALIKYADENFVKFDEGMHPTVGKNAFIEIRGAGSGPKTLTWKPVFTDVAASGDIGYSWGNWKFVLPDTVVYGNYITVWKKQPDGSWKMTFDAGNTSPPPLN